ncbi:hypothetical protein BP00DRAFT_260210 [Aspergillus indologenus CBS 114.80]|uniref:Uncharacterized protein n=1 Tax=Aspergillus indologenus CBS 114.80 TaxID=1450541 RepID=A0A2V5I0E9_9EURO|nr:hypothetical protein BP00DRAFT_260210 [Aspergillus indologenus CBS 114.80]
MQGWWVWVVGGERAWRQGHAALLSREYGVQYLSIGVERWRGDAGGVGVNAVLFWLFHHRGSTSSAEDTNLARGSGGGGSIAMGSRRLTLNHHCVRLCRDEALDCQMYIVLGQRDGIQLLLGLQRHQRAGEQERRRAGECRSGSIKGWGLQDHHLN